MLKVIIAAVVVLSCSIEENPSTGILSEWATENSQVGEEPISFERADVNGDGTVNINDLTAVSYWFGENGDNRPIKRGIKSGLLTNSTIEVGKLFEISVDADLAMGAAWPQKFASDFISGGIHDETCQITVELQGINGEGQVIEDAIIGKFIPNLDEIAYQPDIYINGNARYRAWVSGYFTDSALENGVDKIMIKSGSVCQNKTIQPRQTREIAVNITERSDSREVQAKITELGTMVINFSPSPQSDPEKNGFSMIVIVVDDDQLQRAFFDSRSGVYRRAYRSGNNYRSSGFINGSRGLTYQGQEMDYSIYHFKHYSEIGENVPEICVAGDRVLVLLKNWEKDSWGRYNLVSERLYESDCASGGH